jgi:hypothetical protein
MALHVGQAKVPGEAIARAVKILPTARLDREWMTAQGVFIEDRVSHVYDQPSLDAARFFNRTRAPRQDYPRLGRGMPPQVGEGFEHPYSDTGGMMFGEVWQYTHPYNDFNDIERIIAPARGPKGNLPEWYKPKSPSGITAYRCGDAALAMAYAYLRTGDQEVFKILNDHAMLYCDWAIAHPEGWCHYYCSWTARCMVYSRLSGPVMCYLATGEPWWWEVAEQMGGYMVNAWRTRPKGRHEPLDTQTRTAYPARGLCMLYEITGHRSYWNTAADLAAWVMATGMRDDGAMRGFTDRDDRFSQLYSGYTMLGLIPVHRRCGNERLLAALRKNAEWLLPLQGTYRSRGAGGWERDVLCYGKVTKSDGGESNASDVMCGEIMLYLAELTGEQKYFYSGAAAWANAVTSTRHEGAKGGLCMGRTYIDVIGTWSDKLPVYLDHVPAVAQRFGWPFVVEGHFDIHRNGRRRGVRCVFIARDGRYGNGVFQQGLYAENAIPSPILVWCPGHPKSAEYDGTKIEMGYDPQTQIARLILPAGSKPGMLTMTFAGQ